MPTLLDEAKSKVRKREKQTLNKVLAPINSLAAAHMETIDRLLIHQLKGTTTTTPNLLEILIYWHKELYDYYATSTALLHNQLSGRLLSLK